MVAVEKILAVLKQAQQEYALESLRSPKEHGDYEFGRLVGWTQCFEHSIELITSLQKESKDESTNTGDGLSRHVGKPLIGS